MATGQTVISLTKYYCLGMHKLSLAALQPCQHEGSLCNVTLVYKTGKIDTCQVDCYNWNVRTDRWHRHNWWVLVIIQTLWYRGFRPKQLSVQVNVLICCKHNAFSWKINSQQAGMVDSHNIIYLQISVGVRVGMKQQIDEKVKIEAKAATPNILLAQLRIFKFRQLVEECILTDIKKTENNKLRKPCGSFKSIKTNYNFNFIINNIHEIVNFISLK